MATNKHAIVRYNTLDKCFSNNGRKYFIEDLVQACNEALLDFYGIEDGVKKRQVFEDIKFMESAQGWSVPLVKIRDGQRVYYRYTDISFSIRNQVLSDAESKQLKDTIAILGRFHGMPQLEWLEEIIVRLEGNFSLNRKAQLAVSFQQNPYLRGLSHFSKLFHAIENRKVLSIEYKSFNQDAPITMVIHPYYLKQFNNRWFLFGFNPHYQALSNLPLDRIVSIATEGNPFIENTTIDFEDYFDDVVGVTVDGSLPVEEVLLKVDNKLWPYIETKPIHGSQKIIERTITHITIRLELRANYELENLLFGYGEQMEVLAPQALRDRMKSKVQELFKKYF